MFIEAEDGDSPAGVAIEVDARSLSRFFEPWLLFVVTVGALE